MQPTDSVEINALITDQFTVAGSLCFVLVAVAIQMTLARERDRGHLAGCHAWPPTPAGLLGDGVDRRRSDVPPMPLPIGDRHRSYSRRSLMSSPTGVRPTQRCLNSLGCGPASTDGAGSPGIFGLLVAYFPMRD